MNLKYSYMQEKIDNLKVVEEVKSIVYIKRKKLLLVLRLANLLTNLLSSIVCPRKYSKQTFNFWSE